MEPKTYTGISITINRIFKGTVPLESVREIQIPDIDNRYTLDELRGMVSNNLERKYRVIGMELFDLFREKGMLVGAADSPPSQYCDA